MLEVLKPFARMLVVLWLMPMVPMLFLMRPSMPGMALASTKVNFAGNDAAPALKAIHKRCRGEDEGFAMATHAGYAACFMNRLRFERRKYICDKELREKLVAYIRLYFKTLEEQRAGSANMLASPMGFMMRATMADSAIDSGNGSFEPDDRLIAAMRGLAAEGGLSLSDFSGWLGVSAPPEVVELLKGIQLDRGTGCRS